MSVETVRYKMSTLPYKGLTVVLGKPSRFDRAQLLSGYGGQMFFNALSPLARQSVDVFLADALKNGEVSYKPDTKVVLLLGQKALDMVATGVSIDEQRGCPIIKDGITYVPSYEPQEAVDRQAYFNPNDSDDKGGGDDKGRHGKTRRPNRKFWLTRDVKKAVAYLTMPPEVTKAAHVLWPRADEVVRILTETKGKNMYFDIETNRSLEMTCFGFSFDEKRAWCVPMVVSPREGYYYSDTPRILRALAVAMRDNTTVIHNSLFDLFVMGYKYGIPAPRRVYDTMLAHHRLFPEVEKSLGHCLSLYTDQPYHKNEGVFEAHGHEQQTQLYEYNAKDVISMALLQPQIDATAANFKATDSIQQVNDSVVPYLTAMLQGIRYDDAKLDDIIANNDRHQNVLLRFLRLLVGKDLNPNSPKQVADYLYNRLGYKRPSKDITSEKALLQLRLSKPDNPVMALILRYRSLAKESGQLKFPPWDGVQPLDHKRITTAYNLAGTTSYRLASRRLLGKWGTNVQNFPKKLRKLFVADPGNVLVQADQAGAEALVVSYLCREGNFRSLFANGVKSHVYVALRLFEDVWAAELGQSIKDYCEAPAAELVKLPRWQELKKLISSSDNWSADKRYYFMAKMVCHASNYGMKAPTFRVNVLQKSGGAVNLTNKRAVFFLETYHTLFPEIRLWHRETIAELKRTRILRNLFGYPRMFTQTIDPSMFKEAYAFVPQSTVGCITNMAFTDLYNNARIRELGADVIQNNHDSVLLQCSPDAADEVAKLACVALNREMTSPFGETFKMKSEAMIGENWGDMIDV
jgi:DNA polymerase I-like protein with 3'-5' exonuclease and polymerase domains